MNNERLGNPEFQAEMPVTYKETMNYMKEINREISPLLRDAVASIDDQGSREMVNYFFEPRYNKPKGRPLLTRLSFELTADLMQQAEPSLENSPALDPKMINNLLVAIRLLDGTSILHDDILDHDETRDSSEKEPERESVWKKYKKETDLGVEKAMIAGEKSHELANIFFRQAIDDQERIYVGLARQSDNAQIYPMENRIVTVLNQPDSEAKIKMDTAIHKKVIAIWDSIWDQGYSGQRQDYEEFGRDTTPTIEVYEQRMYLLTGQFHEKVMLLGAYAAGLDDEGEGREILEALGSYGKYYGVAAQLRNDLLDFVPEGGFNQGTAADRKFKYQDFVEGKQTMPLILAREKCSPEDWEYIHSKLGKKDITIEEKQRINEILVSYNIFKDCERRIFELSKMAIAELDKIPGGSRKKEMLKTCALIESNMIKRSFAGEDTNAQDIKLDSLEDLEKYFSE